MHVPASAEAKIARGREHIEAVDVAITAFLDAMPYSLDRRLKSEGRVHEYVMTQYTEPPRVHRAPGRGRRAQPPISTGSHRVLVGGRRRQGRRTEADKERGKDTPVPNLRLPWRFQREGQ